MALLPISGAVVPDPIDYLSENEFRVLERVESVLADEISGLAYENDRVGRYPIASIDHLKETGLFQMSLPTDLGGGGASQRFSLEVQLRISMVDSAVAQIFKVHDELVREIPFYSSLDQRVALGQAVVEGNKILGLAVAEQGRTAEDPLTTTCELNDHGDYVVDGKKIYTTGAAQADLIATWAFNQAAATADNPLLGMQLFLIPKGTPGVTIHEDWNALGQRATDSGAITFEQVVCPAEWRSSVPGRAPLVYASLRYQAGFAAVLTGIGFGALLEAGAFVAEKSRPWAIANVANAADDLTIQRNMGDYSAHLAAAYHATMATAPLFAKFQQGDISRAQLALPISAAKVVAHDAALKSTSEIHGLMGTRSVDMRYGFDRYWRNARTLTLHDPVEYKRIEIGRHLLTGWAPDPGVYQ